MRSFKLNNIDTKLLNSKYKDGVVFETERNIEYTDGGIFNLLGLKKAGKISSIQVYEMYLPYLEKCFEINTGAMKMTIPLLEFLDSGVCYNLIRLSFPKLKECRFLSSPTAIGVDMPLLKKIEILYCNSAVSINLPSLEYVLFGNINCASAKKIIIPKRMIQRLFKVPEGCEIIDSENIQQESFKSFFNRQVIL